MWQVLVSIKSWHLGQFANFSVREAVLYLKLFFFIYKMILPTQAKVTKFASTIKPVVTTTSE